MANPFLSLQSTSNPLKISCPPTAASVWPLLTTAVPCPSHHPPPPGSLLGSWPPTLHCALSAQGRLWSCQGLSPFTPHLCWRLCEGRPTPWACVPWPDANAQEPRQPCPSSNAQRLPPLLPFRPATLALTPGPLHLLFLLPGRNVLPTWLGSLPFSNLALNVTFSGKLTLTMLFTISPSSPTPFFCLL